MKPDSALRTVILAAIEPSIASDQVIKTAAAMARITPGADLHLLHVINPGPPPHEMVLSLTDLMAEGRHYLEGAIAAAGSDTSCRVSAHLALGIPAERIVQVAADISADLVIVGTHEKTGLSRILGSVSQKVLAKAPCAVLVARAKEAPGGPEIEPPCPACLEAQRLSNGETLWCSRHAERRVHSHLHYSPASGFGGGSMFVRS